MLMGHRLIIRYFESGVISGHILCSSAGANTPAHPTTLVPGSIMPSLRRAAVFGMLTLATLPGCAERRAERRRECTDCATLVVGAAGEPSSLVPPLVVETVGRDISDLVFERLADLAP